MMLRSFGLILSSIVFLSVSAFGTPAQVLLIRHAEKPLEGDNLSPAGYEHAKQLVDYFKTNSKVTEFGTPVAIFAMKASNEDSSNRPLETVTPLANSLGLTIHNKFTKTQIKDLTRKILDDSKFDGKMVLVCWEHKMIDKIAKELGVSPEPDAWDGDVFDQVWEVDFHKDRVVDFKIYRQDLK